MQRGGKPEDTEEIRNNYQVNILVTRKMQIQIAMKYYFTSTRLVKFKNSGITESGPECRKSHTFLPCWQDYMWYQLLQKNS